VRASTHSPNGVAAVRGSAGEHARRVPEPRALTHCGEGSARCRAPARQRVQCRCRLGDAEQVEARVSLLAELREPAARGSLVVLRLQPFDREQDRGGLCDPDPRELGGRGADDQQAAAVQRSPEPSVSGRPVSSWEHMFARQRTLERGNPWRITSDRLTARLCARRCGGVVCGVPAPAWRVPRSSRPTDHVNGAVIGQRPRSAPGANDYNCCSATGSAPAHPHRRQPAQQRWCRRRLNTHPARRLKMRVLNGRG
jgi:hypothetical protein